MADNEKDHHSWLLGGVEPRFLEKSTSNSGMYKGPAIPMNTSAQLHNHINLRALA